MDFDTLISACYTINNELSFVPKKESEYLHSLRCQLEPYVFNYLTYTYGPALDEFWKKHTFPKKSNRAFVIVERRPHPNWWFVLRNIAWAAPHFSLYIFCSDLNYDFVRTLLGHKADSVHIIRWFTGCADKHTGYMESNSTLKIPNFYKLIDAEYFLNVHLDAYFLQKIPDWIFTGTYYGAPWRWDVGRAGNGGLSVRNTRKMYELCLKECEGALNECIEDTYISDALIKHGFDFPPLEFRMRVFQESFPTEFTPIGTHQFWTYITNYNMNDLRAFKDNIKKLVTLVGL